MLQAPHLLETQPSNQLRAVFSEVSLLLAPEACLAQLPLLPCSVRVVHHHSVHNLLQVVVVCSASSKQAPSNLQVAPVYSVLALLCSLEPQDSHLHPCSGAPLLLGGDCLVVLPLHHCLVPIPRLRFLVKLLLSSPRGRPCLGADQCLAKGLPNRLLWHLCHLQCQAVPPTAPCPQYPKFQK